MAAPWRDRAACADPTVDPQDFDAKDHKITREGRISINRALAVCARCPVQAQCAAELSSDTDIRRDGVYGGEYVTRVMSFSRLQQARAQAGLTCSRWSAVGYASRVATR